MSSPLFKIWLILLILGGMLILVHSQVSTSLDYQEFSTTREKILQEDLIDFLKKENLYKSDHAKQEFSTPKNAPLYLP